MYQKPKLNFFLWWPVIIVSMIFWPLGVTLLIIRIYKDKATALRVGQIIRGFSYVIFFLTAYILIISPLSEDTSYWSLVSTFLFLAITLFLISGKLMSGARRTRQYMSSIINHHERSIDTIARIVGKKPSSVVKDIAKLIDSGMLRGAIIDHSSHRIILPHDHNLVHETRTVNSSGQTNANLSAMDGQLDNMNAQGGMSGQSVGQAQAAAAQARVAQCKYCGANNSMTNDTGECEYCGSPL